MNDSVALHDGNVCLDNLQLQTTTTTGKQHGGKNTVSDQVQQDGTKSKKGRERKRGRKEIKSEHAPYWHRKQGGH